MVKIIIRDYLIDIKLCKKYNFLENSKDLYYLVDNLFIK